MSEANSSRGVSRAITIFASYFECHETQPLYFVSGPVRPLRPALAGTGGTLDVEPVHRVCTREQYHAETTIPGRGGSQKQPDPIP